jgi:ABC-type nickel/cobalt efflux system permease component RcnA
MRRAVLILTLVALGALTAAWAGGWFDALSAWASQQQRGVQNALAGGLRALRAGEPGALAALLGLCFAYGLAHAAGPGHGKVLIGGYAAASRVPPGRAVAIAVAASLAQATTAVVLVYAGVVLLGWTRDRVVGTADEWLAPFSHAAIGLVGLWLVWRGALRLWRRNGGAGHGHAHTAHAHGHGHDHAHHEGCGHRHGPSAEEIAAAGTWREAAVLIAGVAMRPCAGALFLLALTWGMAIPLAGILGAYAMGLGVAAVTVAVALGGVWLRTGLAVSLGDGTAGRVLLPVLELAVGLAVAAVALRLLVGSV